MDLALPTLHKLLIWISKFNLLSVVHPSNFTGLNKPIFLLSISIEWLIAVLLKTKNWNFPGSANVWLSLNHFNSLSANPKHTQVVKYTQTFDGKLPTNCLSVFDHFVGSALKGLKLFSSHNEDSELQYWEIMHNCIHKKFCHLQSYKQLFSLSRNRWFKKMLKSSYQHIIL